MQPKTLVWCLSLIVLLPLGAVAQTVVGTAVPAPAPVDVTAGDDAWNTTFDRGTSLDYRLNPLPAGFFGPGSNPFSQQVFLFGIPIANSAGLGWHTDTLVRRLANTGLLAVGSCATIPIDFQALHLQSLPFTVTYTSGATERWMIVGGLSTAAAQPIGSMTMCRTCGDGGTFSARLPALFVLRYVRTSPLPQIQFTMDCGLGQCPAALFQTSSAQWALAGGPSGFNPTASGIDPLPPGVQVDADADGILDPTTTIGRSNFQGGIQLCGGGGGGPACAKVSHVGGGGQDHQKSSHSNYVSASGDADGNGIPDWCECNDENGDGIDDDTGDPCPKDGDVFPADPTDPGV